MKYFLFDKEGNNINLINIDDDNKYNCNIYFNITSVRIPSVEQIYVLDSNLNPVDVTITFNSETSIFKGFNREGELIIDNVFEFNGQINIYTEHNEAGIFEDVMTITDNVNNNIIAVVSLEVELYDEEERFKTLLESLYNTDLLPNADIYYAFRESNIKEKNIDWKILNNKRKELLMLGHEIFPFIGADKALINMINFLGYADSDVKEIWKNIDHDSNDFGKLKYIQNKYQAYKRGENVSNTFEGSTSWEKTNRFGLFFKYNKIDGVDEHGTPIVIDNYNYTIDEILIKFKKVKDYLNDKFLPLNIKLHSITGEGLYFERIKVVTFNENTVIYGVDLDLEPEIRMHNDKIIYLEDLRNYNNTYFNLLKKENNKWVKVNHLKCDDFPDGVLGAYFVDTKNYKLYIFEQIKTERKWVEINDFTFGYNEVVNTKYWFSDIYDININDNIILYQNNMVGLSSRNIAHKVFDDKPEAPIAARVILELGGLFEKVKDLNFNMNGFKTAYPKVTDPLYPNDEYKNLNSFGTWKYVKFGQNYECEWILTNKENNYVYRHRDFIKNNHKHIALLPYIGIYNIQVTVYDLENKHSICIINDAIEVKMNMPLLRFFKIKNGNIFKLKDIPTVPFKNITGKLNNLFTNNFKVKDFFTKVSAFDVTKYLHTEKYDKNFADIINVNRFNNYIEINNIKGDISKLVNTKILAKNNVLYDIKSIIIDINNYLIIEDNIEYIKTVLNKNKHLIVPLYQKIPVDFYIDRNDMGYRLHSNTLGYQYRYVVNGIYFNAIDVYKSESDFEYFTIISEEVYNELQTHVLYNINNFYLTELLGYDNTTNRVLFKDPDNYKLDYIYDINSPIYFDILTGENEFVINTSSYDSTLNRLYIKETNKYHLLSKDTKIFWSSFDINLIDTLENVEFDITKYNNTLYKDKTFILTAPNGFQNTFFEINGERMVLYSEDIIKELNNFKTNFYFVQDPFTKNNIIGVKKLDNDYDNYIIETYNGLYVNNTYKYEIKPSFKSLFTFNNIEIFHDSMEVKNNQDIFFNLGESNIKGHIKTNIKILSNNRLIYETSRNYFKYNFKNNGYYNIDIELEDNNGNKIKKHLNNFLHVK
jgi:hypothetical protein